MKSKGKYILLVFVVIGCIWFLPKVFFPSPKVGLPASCYISDNYYWPTNTIIQKLDDSYKTYGIISTQVDHQELKDDLSTLNEELLNKEVFINQEDLSSIYIKTDKGYELFKTEQTIY